uniref:Variant surface glycoprotein 1125.5581 n=1 Tax=Trypanosoma brucei TaxID=5691 RepID=A0A1J0RCP1_9TRYP|nr:variant surface glycoprotein 1125.5581 [Trypanosoma brucei]
MREAATNSLETGSNLQAGATAELLSNCPTETSTNKSADELRTALPAFQSMVGQGNNVEGAVVYGRIIAKVCPKEASSCVHYQKSFKKNAKGFAGIEWLAKVKQALEMQTTYDKHKQQVAATKTKIQRAAQTAIELYKASEMPKEDGVTTKTFPTASPTSAERSCGNHITNTTCTDNNCKWEGTAEDKGTCKPKSGEEQTSAAAGTDGADAQHTSMIKKNVKATKVVNGRVKHAKITVFLLRRILLWVWLLLLWVVEHSSLLRILAKINKIYEILLFRQNSL